MTADDQTIAHTPDSSRGGLRAIGRISLRRVLRPYLRRQAATTTTLARLEADLEHVRERHTEQIERLEELVRELVLTAESLRRAIAAREHGGEE
jgi:alanyl-tRNA synthetase